MSSLHHSLWIEEEECAFDRARFNVSTEIESNLETMLLNSAQESSRNMFYLTSGNESYQYDIIRNITHGFGLYNTSNVYCLDAQDNLTIQKTIFSLLQTERWPAVPTIQKKLLIIHNIHKLTDNTIRNIDFIFPLYERSSSIQGLTVLFTMPLLNNNDNKRHTNNTVTLHEWKDWLSSRYHSLPMNFNGIAFVSRIHRFAIQDPLLPLLPQPLIGIDNNDDDDVDNISFCQNIVNPNLHSFFFPNNNQNTALLLPQQPFTIQHFLSTTHTSIIKPYLYEVLVMPWIVLSLWWQRSKGLAVLCRKIVHMLFFTLWQKKK